MKNWKTFVADFNMYLYVVTCLHTFDQLFILAIFLVDFNLLLILVGSPLKRGL